jgi:hypothetical protein
MTKAELLIELEFEPDNAVIILDNQASDIEVIHGARIWGADGNPGVACVGLRVKKAGP